MVVDSLRLEQELERGRPAPLYLLTGEEDFLIEEALHRFEEAAERCPFPAREHYLGKEVLARDLIESACTLPLGGGFRLLVVEEAQGIPAAEREGLLPYLADPCPTSCLVFTWPGKKLGVDKLAAALKKTARMLQFPRLKPGELKAWVRDRAKQSGLTVETAALEALVEGSGGSLRDLAGELDKAALVAKGGRLRASDLAALTRHGEVKPWEVAELACRGDAPGALVALGGLLEAGGSAGAVLSNLSRHIRKVLLAAELAAQGASEGEIAQGAGVFPWLVRSYLEQAKRGRGRLVGMLSEVLSAELDLKRSAAPERERLERLVLCLAR